MTNHFKISLGIVFIAAVALIGGYEYVLHRIDGKLPVFEHRAVPVLPKNDKETVSFNEKTHVLTVVTATKTVKEYAKSPEVEIRKDGSVMVSRHLTGFENEPFIGFGYSDTGRVFIGDNLFHFSRFDLVGAVSWTPSANAIAFKPYMGFGWNCYHNTSINLALNPLFTLQNRSIDISGFVSIRL